MSETSFPVNDLLRRKPQTSLVVISLTLCVASTLFLLLFGEKIGFEISLMVEGKLTAGFSMVFSRFMIFIWVLIFVVGAVIISFMVFVMMSQRIRDIGLMKAAGCPNDLIFGYFMTELLIVTFIGCFLGVVLGILADFASTSLLNSLGFQILQKPINFWFILLVFVLFFALALIFGAKPILDTAKVEPAKAISPTYYFGLSKEPGFKVISKSGFTFKIALRSLFRRKSATVRIVLCLTAVFILVTVAVAGGIIADQTTKSWIEKAVGRDIVLIAHKDMCDQYKLLLSKFYEAKEESQFNYTDTRCLILENLLNELSSISGIIGIDQRLVLKTHVKEVQGYVIDPETAATIPVGDDREGESLIVGVEHEKVLSEWFLDGEFLKGGQVQEAVIGDSLAQKMFSMPLNQSIKLFDRIFDVIGVCLDPVNNGNVTYVPLKTLQNITGISGPNIVMVKIDASVNRADVLNHMQMEIENIHLEFEVFELNEILDKNLSFLGYIWSTIMFLPLFSLVATSLCLIGYVMLTITEQRQEFGVLRAIGANPRTVVKIVSGQSFIVLLSSYAAGIAIGIILTLLILVPEPLVTSYTVIEIAGWLLIALVATFIFSLYPAVKFAEKPILEIMA
ncbi:MAG: FtsX-like permease family protein [Candidatus Bathyarchaeota archaeon]|nr:FtsX-like permease family protein [Candidatus Bathyarchaeota archaeon]